MKLSLLVAALCLIQLTAAVTIEIKRAQSQVHLASEAGADEWGYGQNGADWAGLCASGKAQSPINVDKDKARCVKAGDSGWKNYALQFRYQRANNLTMQHDGHALIVPTTATSSLGYVISGCAECSNSRYSVKQFQFHAPSEHTINGRQYDAELQIQHQRDGATDNNDLLNVAILFYVNPNGTGLPHRFLNNIEWYASPSAAGQAHAINGCVDLNLFKQEVFEHDYYAYQGSRTTPGCEESVAWRVMATPQGVTQLQLDVLTNLFAKNSAFAAGKGNNRKVQDLNGREVVLYKRYGGVF